MTIFPLGKRPRKNSKSKHPYLSGNFAPVIGEYISHTCEIVQGRVPEELYGGQYVRNGGNPVNPPDEGRNYHWCVGTCIGRWPQSPKADWLLLRFDGDGMLHGVYFPKPASEGSDPNPPQYTNRHVSTPILSLSLMLLRAPLPSISLLISPLTSLHRILGAIITTFLMAFEAGVGTLSVVNTNVLWWGAGLGSEAAEEERMNNENKGTQGSNAQRGSGKTGRLLGLCESGPPMEVRVPELQTVGWDRLEDDQGEQLSETYGKWDPRGWRLARIQEVSHMRVSSLRRPCTCCSPYYLI
jgi:carotenoid cleavage dioxygenase-like enzyme